MNNSFDNTWSSNSSSQWGETGEERLEANQESAFSPQLSQHSQRGSPSHSRISQHETSFGYSPIKLSSSAVEIEENTNIQNNQNRNNSEISQIDKILSQFNSPTSQKSISRHSSQYSQQSNSFKHSSLSQSRSRSQSQNNQQIGSEIEKQKQDQNNQNNKNEIFQIQSDIPEDIQLVDEQQQIAQQEQERNNKNKINIEQNSQQQFELQNELENENEKNWKDRISEVGSGFVNIIHRVSSGIVSLKDTTERRVRNSISSLRSQDEDNININNNTNNNNNNKNNNIVYYDEQEEQWNDETTSNNNIQDNKNYNIKNQQLTNDNQSKQQQQQQVYQQSPIYSNHLQSPIPLTQPRHSSQQQYHSPLIAHEQQQILNQNQQQIQKQQTQQQQQQQIQQQQQQQNIVNNSNNNINRPTFFDNIKSQVNIIIQKCKISSSKAYNQISDLNNKYYKSLPHYLYFIILFILLILFILIIWIILRIFQYLLINKNDNEYNQQLRYGYQYQQKSSYQYSDQKKVKQEKKMKNQLKQEYKKEKLKSPKKNNKCIEDIDRIMKLVDKGRKDIEKLVKQQKIGFLCKQSGKCVKIPKGYEFEQWDEMNRKKQVNNMIDDNEDEDQEYESDTNDDEIDNYVLPRNNNNKLQSKQIKINNKQQSNNNQYIYLDPINEGITIAGIRSILDSKYGQYICDNQQSIFDYNDFDQDDDEQEEKLNLREKRGMKPIKIEIEEEEEEEEQEDDDEIDEQQKINKRKSTKQSYSYKSALKQLDKERINKRENFTEFVNTIIDSIIPDSSVILKMKDSEYEQQTYSQKQTYSSSTNKQMIAQSPNEQYALYFPIPTKKRQQYNPFSYKSSYSHKYHQSQSQQQQYSSQYPISYSAELVLTNNPSLPFTCHVSHYLAKHGTSLFSIFQKLLLISIILIILLIIIMIKVKDYKLVNEMYNVVVSTLQVQQLKKMIWLDEQINERKMKKFQNETRKQLNKDEEFEIQISNRSLSSSRNRNVNKQINNKSEAERV